MTDERVVAVAVASAGPVPVPAAVPAAAAASASLRCACSAAVAEKELGSDDACDIVVDVEAGDGVAAVRSSSRRSSLSPPLPAITTVS